MNRYIILYTKFICPVCNTNLDTYFKVSVKTKDTNTNNNILNSVCREIIYCPNCRKEYKKEMFGEGVI